MRRIFAPAVAQIGPRSGLFMSGSTWFLGCSAGVQVVKLRSNLYFGLRKRQDKLAGARKKHVV